MILRVFYFVTNVEHIYRRCGIVSLWKQVDYKELRVHWRHLFQYGVLLRAGSRRCFDAVSADKAFTIRGREQIPNKRSNMILQFLGVLADEETELQVNLVHSATVGCRILACES